jgi:hypothetical protein
MSDHDWPDYNPPVAKPPTPEPDEEARTYTEAEYIEYGERQYKRGREQAEYEATHGEVR